MTPDKKDGIFWGGVTLPASCGSEHFAIVGSPGSGKTLSLQLLMKSVLPGIVPGSGRRAVIYDAKRDTWPLLKGIFREQAKKPSLCLLNPFDLRSTPWAMSQDIQDGATAYQIASILIPVTGNETQPFFINAARDLLGGVMHAFTELAPGKWTLRDVVYTMRDSARIAAVLSACEQTAYLPSVYFDGSKREGDVIATLQTFMQGLKFVAAAWEHAAEEGREGISLEQWLDSESILILGSDPKFDFVLQSLNRAIFKRMVELVRRQPEIQKGETRQTWFIIDELRNAGNLEDLDKLLVEGRSKGACVVLGFQDMPGLRKAFGDESADEIIGACANKVFLQNGEGKTIEYASQHFKSQEILETRVSHSNNATPSGPSSQGFSINRQKVMRPVVHEGNLKSLPKPKVGKVGLSGYCDTAAIGTDSPYRMDLSPEFLDRELPQPDGNEPGFCARPPSHFKLRKWDLDDLKRLELGQFPQLLEKSPPPLAPGLSSQDPEDDEPNDDESDLFKIK